LQQPQQRIAEQVRVFAIIEPKFKLFKVRGQMLGADLMIGTNDRTLKKAKNAFNGICVNIAAHRFIIRVVNRIVARVVIAATYATRLFVRVDIRGIRVNVPVDERVKRVAVWALVCAKA